RSGGAAPRQPYQAMSPQLAQSPILRGQHSALSPREALILMCLINHPWLLHDHLEEVAELELAHPDAQRLRAAVIAVFAGGEPHATDPAEQSEALRGDLAQAGVAGLVERIERAVTTSAVWGAQPGAA